MAEFILKHMAEDQGLKEELLVESAATSDEEIWAGQGNPIYPPAQRELKSHGIGVTEYTDFSKKRARQIRPEDYEGFDYLLCADNNNLRNTLRITGGDNLGKVRLMLDFAEDPLLRGRSISDPWYTGDFCQAYSDIEAACRGLLNHLKQGGQGRPNEE